MSGNEYLYNGHTVANGGANAEPTPGLKVASRCVTLTGEDGADMTVEYALVCEGIDGEPAYSISARLTRSGAVGDEAVVHDVTRDPDAALRLLGSLCAGGVTPCTLADVVADLIADPGTA